MLPSSCSGLPHTYWLPGSILCVCIYRYMCSHHHIWSHNKLPHTFWMSGMYPLCERACVCVIWFYVVIMFRATTSFLIPIGYQVVCVYACIYRHVCGDHHHVSGNHKLPHTYWLSGMHSLCVCDMFLCHHTHM